MHDIQVSKDSINGYTGEGEPPCIVMTLRATPDDTTPTDLSLPVTITGVNEPSNKIVIKRTAEGKYYLDSYIKLTVYE